MNNKTSLMDLILGFSLFLFITIGIISRSEVYKLISNLMILGIAIYYVRRAFKCKKGNDLRNFKIYLVTSILLGIVPVIIML